MFFRFEHNGNIFSVCFFRTSTACPVPSVRTCDKVGKPSKAHLPQRQAYHDNLQKEERKAYSKGGLLFIENPARPARARLTKDFQKEMARRRSGKHIKSIMISAGRARRIGGAGRAEKKETTNGKVALAGDESQSFQRTPSRPCKCCSSTELEK